MDEDAAGAGVAGTAAAAFSALGCSGGSAIDLCGGAQHGSAEAAHTLFTTQTTKPFSSMLYVSTVSSSFKILPVVGGQVNMGKLLYWQTHRGLLTSVDQLQQLSVPSFLCSDLFFDGRDLVRRSALMHS